MLTLNLPPELWNLEAVQQEPPSLPTDSWLQLWLSSLQTSSISIVPFTASSVHTPLCMPAWCTMLRNYPDKQLVQFVLEGISKGFRIGFGKPASSLNSARSNLYSALEHPEVVTEYLRTKMSLGRVAGPFPPRAVPHVHVSRFGVIPKGQTGKWRLIVDLSHPKGHSVNDGILPHLCSLQYVTIDEAVKGIIQRGQGTLLAKIDVKSAFRLLPVHPADRHLLGMEWQGGIYIDTCLPFGLRSAPKLFNVLAEMLSWIAKQRNVSFLIHYLDDFLTMGPSSSSSCQYNLDTIIQICNYLGVPLALEKVEGPSTTLPFLGITLDTIKMEARLPEDKLGKLKDEVAQWVTYKKVTKRAILSLVESLQHATKVVRFGSAFLSRMYATAAKLRELHYLTRLDGQFRSDLGWWHTFLTEWNGISLLRWDDDNWTPEYHVQMDASGSWGCGAFWDGQWL